jgi:hypothetical protein
VSNAPVNRSLVMAFTSVAMLAGFVVISFLALPVRGDADEVPLAWGLVFLLIPSAFAAVAFSFVTQGAGGRPVPAAVAVFLGGIGSSIVFAGFQELVLVLAPLGTALVALLATRLLGHP